MNITALATAPAAREWLLGSKSGRVLNVFDRTCNLVNPSGEVLSLVSNKGSLTPFGLLLPAGMPPLSAVISDSSSVRVVNDQLLVGSLTIEWHTAETWRPTPDWSSLRRSFADGTAMPAFAFEWASLPARGSLLELFRAPYSEVAMSSPVNARMWAGAQALVQGLRTGERRLAMDGALLLAGLGGGLTPAGDDFIVGVFLSAWAGLYGLGLESMAAPVADAAAKRTTTLSGAFLRAAARGECSAPWLALFEALLSEKPDARRRALTALLAVGHSSGGDGLAGFLAVHLMAAGRPVSTHA